MNLHIAGYDVEIGAAAVPVVLLYFAVVITTFIAMIRVIQRAGYSGWWILVSFVPVVNLIAFWYFAFARWPAIDGKKAAQG